MSMSFIPTPENRPTQVLIETLDVLATGLDVFTTEGRRVLQERFDREMADIRRDIAVRHAHALGRVIPRNVSAARARRDIVGAYISNVVSLRKVISADRFVALIEREIDTLDPDDRDAVLAMSDRVVRAVSQVDGAVLSKALEAMDIRVDSDVVSDLGHRLANTAVLLETIVTRAEDRRAFATAGGRRVLQEREAEISPALAGELARRVAPSMSNEDLAHRIRVMAATPEDWSIGERQAFAYEAAKRLVEVDR